MNLNGIIQKIRHNHSLMMIICCGAPLLVLVILVYGFGLRSAYLSWGILLLCPLAHLFMMKGMHKKQAVEDRQMAHAVPPPTESAKDDVKE